MQIPNGLADEHNWNLSVQEAIELQKRLRGQVVSTSWPQKVDLIAGVDMGLDGDYARSAIVIMTWPGLEPIEAKTAVSQVKFPYVPGLLAFRELPTLLKAIEQIKNIPDIFLVDGQGIAHPRRFGIASHLGVLIDKPSIGCGKTRLFGKHEKPKPVRGSCEFLYDCEDKIGAVLVTRDGTNPIYVSVGHKVTLEWSIDFVLKCSPKYRIPEPTRLADKLASGESVMHAQRSFFRTTAFPIRSLLI